MDSYNEIIINWSKYFDIIYDTETKKIISGTENFKSKNLIYQIYGDSNTYGRNVLLYIGITRDRNENKRDLESRIKEHLLGVFGFVNNLKICIGKITSDNNNKETIELAESILIANHKPIFNKTHIHNISKNAFRQKTIIINNGNNGMLSTCNTNFWWVNDIKSKD